MSENSSVRVERAQWSSVRLLLEAAKKMGVRVRPLSQQHSIYEFTLGSKRAFVTDHVASLNSYVSSRITRDKSIASAIIKQAGFSVPAGRVFTNLQQVKSELLAGNLAYPLVIKPVDGSQGAAVMADIQTEDWLERAITEVQKYNRRTKGKPNSFLVEEYISGDDYRLLVLDGRVLTVLMRKPAYVIGDGSSTIQELIDAYNAQPDFGKHKPLCPITVDYEIDRILARKNLSLGSIVRRGQKVVLRKNANVSTGGRSFECTEKVAEQYKKIAVAVAHTFGLRFCAVDLITRTISKFGRYAIIEVNDTPGFDIHEVPYRGRSFPVAEHVVAALFQEAESPFLNRNAGNIITGQKSSNVFYHGGVAAQKEARIGIKI